MGRRNTWMEYESMGSRSGTGGRMEFVSHSRSVEARIHPRHIRKIPCETVMILRLRMT
jgi:hypothetical protein